jgi:hypothetical protein
MVAPFTSKSGGSEVRGLVLHPLDLSRGFCFRLTGD